MNIKLENNFAIGNKYSVLGFKNSNLLLKKKLLDMGLIRGTIFEIVKVSPFGDRIAIFLRGYQLCINKENLNLMELFLIEE